MSDKLDKQIDEAFKRKATLALDSMLENIITETMKEKGLTFSDSDDIQPLLEALDSYVDSSDSVSLLSEAPGSQNTEAAVQKLLASLPKMEVSERWGDPNSQTRSEIKKFTENIGGKTIQDKFNELMKIQTPNSRIVKPSRIIASLILLESLRGMITGANASSAGFAFEGFLAALMNGNQVADPSDGSLPIEDVMLFTYEDVATTKTRPGIPVSLKMLTDKGVVKGSYTNMVDALYREDFGNGVSYVVAYKIGQDTEDFHIRLSENIITKSNFYSIMTHPNASSKNINLFKLDPVRVKLLKTAMPEQAETIESYRKNWTETLKTTSDEVTYALLQCSAGYSVDKFKKAFQASTQVQEAKGGEGGSQWYINASFFVQDNVDIIGEINLSQKAILATAMQYSDILKESIAVLFTAVGNLGVHINEYFVGKKRAQAINSGKEALKDTKQITKTLTKDIAQN